VITADDIKKGRNGDEDRRVVKSLIAAVRNYDKLIGYYSKRFDVPFMRTRALNMGIDFPFYGTIRHIDVYDIIRNRFNMSRKTQENACRNLLGETEKNHVKGNIWRDAARGDQKALSYVLEHNKLYDKVIDYARRNDTSI
jgi:DNA polymerase elongation subunit (family B)